MSAAKKSKARSKTTSTYEVDDPIHVVCSCGRKHCIAPSPGGCDGTVYEDDGQDEMIWVDLLGQNHLYHTADCSCVFRVKRTDVRPR